MRPNLRLIAGRPVGLPVEHRTVRETPLLLIACAAVGIAWILYVVALLVMSLA